MWNIWTHTTGSSSTGEILVGLPGSAIAWVPFKRGSDLPPTAVKAGSTKGDGDIYVARSPNGDAGKLNLEGGKCHNLWCHGNYWSGWKEGDVLTVVPASGGGAPAPPVVPASGGGAPAPPPHTAVPVPASTPKPSGTSEVPAFSRTVPARRAAILDIEGWC